MIFRFMVIANNAPDLFGSLLVVGVMGHIAIQVVLNIAVVTNTIPNTGITLPFISYGVVYHDGNGNCFKRIQPDPAGKIRVRNQLAMHISSHQGI